MPENPILLIDTTFLAHRSLYAYPYLSHKGQPTGVIFGILKEYFQLKEKFGNGQIIWAFDHGTSKRKEILEYYKWKRHSKKTTIEERQRITSMQQQIKLLKEQWLAIAGFSNVLYQNGYEGDDIIASVVLASLKPTQDAVIVSNDKDFYQLLSHRVSVWHPGKQGKLVTDKSFEKEWGIGPSQWAVVKSISGCATDEIPGVKGVGEKIAAKYVRQYGEGGIGTAFVSGGVKKGGTTYEKIMEWIEPNKTRLGDSNNYDRNLKLVKLPLKGTKKFKLKPDGNIEVGVRRLAGSLGMQSLLGNQAGIEASRKRKPIFEDD